LNLTTLTVLLLIRKNGRRKGHLNWKIVTDFIKYRSPLALRVADRLGRGSGRFRFFDGLHRPRAPRKPDLKNWQKHDLAAIWIGHATILLRVGQQTILTDPVFLNRVGIGLGLWTGGPRRMWAPALNLWELPSIDLILISHAHFDHLDRPTLCRLPKSTPIITAHNTSDLIRDLGFRHISELRWGESVNHASLKITAQKVRHWGARTLQDSHRGFNAFLIESAKHRVLYGGDTAHHDYFKEIGKVDLAIVGIGGYPYLQAHANPEQAWDMANHVMADFVLPMHHSTFRLSPEPVEEPMERMMTVAGKSSDRVIIREVGGQWSR
jgi:L-ascorbate metabolism protein UlaG (beta-lactamase superfamily)